MLAIFIIALDTLIMQVTFRWPLLPENLARYIVGGRCNVVMDCVPFVDIGLTPALRPMAATVAPGYKRTATSTGFWDSGFPPYTRP